MELYEKLQELRKNRGLTQEELAEALFVSRTAISKWESGRGTPSIDSLKQISRFFSVSIDDLLSGEALISIAENENKANMQSLLNLLMGVVDLFTSLLVVLPLYPMPMDGYIASVSLFAYTSAAPLRGTVYWILFLLLMGAGVVKIILTQWRVTRGQTLTTGCSFGLSVLAVLFLGLAREAYAITLVFLLLVLKGLLLLQGRHG